MQVRNVLSSITFVVCFIIVNTARADVIEFTGGLESGRFIDGVNLTSNYPTVALSGEWSANGGGFAALSCFAGENVNRVVIQRGCDAKLGWFTPLNERQAISFAVSRHDYSSSTLKGWEYTTASAKWHLGKRYTLAVKATDSLLGQGASGVTTSLQFSQPLRDNWRLKLEAGLTSLQSSAPVDSLEYGQLGIEYAQSRWTTELKFMLSSSDYKRFVKLNIEQPEVAINVRYRIY
ncbi:hypothetical protein [Arenicella xantha]|uniref:Uncharacterized protein n=1 Tax=Arenicella xantha TaxID=644221 RepID=A0A395JIW1_9GAMM|nr:hypothetical protein [Arenicella xantha]RBP50621.1 hypothetical protein DFR28_10232 [Arenicella xantha]